VPLPSLDGAEMVGLTPVAGRTGGRRSMSAHLGAVIPRNAGVGGRIQAPDAVLSPKALPRLGFCGSFRRAATGKPSFHEVKMSWFSTYVRSSIGAKHVMAVTGLAMVLFAIIHMLGHLGMFSGQDAYNSYAHFLQGLGGLKWIARGGLLAVFVIHVASAVRLAGKNRAARPVPYAAYRPVRSTAMGRYMGLTGLVLLAFIIYHLLHFTLGQVQPAFFHKLDAAGRYDAYTMFVRGFENPGIFASYFVAILMLSLHLGHGASSWLQSLGLRHPKYSPSLAKLGPVLSAILFLGYMAPPTAVLLGLIKLPGA
jgi:succinate dehydrogenase / fumarate reductase, cytochrome b subunit